MKKRKAKSDKSLATIYFYSASKTQKYIDNLELKPYLNHKPYVTNTSAMSIQYIGIITDLLVQYKIYIDNTMRRTSWTYTIRSK